MKKKYIIFIIFILCCTSQSYSQTLSIRDKNILRYEAGAFVKELELLLNNLSNYESAKFERDLIIKNSFSPSGNQIFLNEDVIIEDNVNPNNFNYKRVKDFYIEKYLRNFDIFYKKELANSVSFSDIYVSEVKQRDYIYLEVFYQSSFSGNHLTYKDKYQKTSRVATIIASRKGKVWDLKIASIVFYNPKKHSQLFNLRNALNKKTEPIVTTEKEPEQVIFNKINEGKSKYWQISTGGYLTFESNIYKPGLGTFIEVNPIHNRISAQLSISYIFRDSYNLGDTLFTVNRIALGASIEYMLSSRKKSFLPHVSFGFNYLSSTLKRNDIVSTRTGASALGLVIGGGMKFIRKPDDKLFYKSKIAFISGKVQRIYMEAGIGFIINSQ